MKPATAVVENEPPLHTAYSIEIESSVYDKLNDICLVEKIPLKILINHLLSFMLRYHRGEVAELIRRIKHPEAW